MPFDLFISYGRKDDQCGAITHFVESLARAFEFLAGRPLKPFFDRDSIQGMDNWRERILDGLQQSSVLLACITPAYLASPYCEWEFNEFLKGEVGHALAGAGIATVWLQPIADWDSARYDQSALPWVRALRDRNWNDLRDTFSPNPAPLTGPSLDALASRIAQRVLLAERAAASPGNIESRNPRFIGRAPQMQILRHRLASPAAAQGFTALWGLPGIGKTALATEYAHNYAHEYVGGRWQIDCAGAPDLDSAITRLAPALRLSFLPDEPADPAYRAERVLAELRALASAPIEDRTAPVARPRDCFLLLDNVVCPEMLSPAQTSRLPLGHASSESWLHCLVTTPLGPHDLADLPEDCFVGLDELAEDEAVTLIERFQPGGRFSDKVERDAAGEIVRRLQGFTLAVETAAVFLGERTGNTCEEYVRLLDAAGVSAHDAITSAVRGGVRHRGPTGREQRSVTATLHPLLELLADDEMLTLRYAACMPPGNVVWEWIESLTGERFPAIQMAPLDGQADRWTLVRNRLISLRLLTPGEFPWSARIHRLVQEVVANRDDGDKLSGHAREYALKRCAALERDFDREDDAWEVDVLRQWSLHLMAMDPLGGGVVESRVANLLRRLGRFLEELPLRRDVASVQGELLGLDDPITIISSSEFGLCLMHNGRYDEAEPILCDAARRAEWVLGAEHPDTLASVNNLAGLYASQGRYEQAEPLYLRALETQERVLGTEHPSTLLTVNNLAALYLTQGRYGEADLLYQRAMQASGRVLGAEHPITLASLNSLACLYSTQGRYVEAESLHLQALGASDRVLGYEHPDTLKSASDLAALYVSQKRYGEAEPLLRRALEAQEQLLGPDHPDTLKSVNNLGGFYESQGRYAEAEPLCRRTLGASERVLGAEHPHTLLCVRNLGALYYSQDRFGEAAPLIRRALEGAKKLLGPDHPTTKTFANNYAACLAALNRT